MRLTSERVITLIRAPECIESAEYTFINKVNFNVMSREIASYIVSYIQIN